MKRTYLIVSGVLIAFGIAFTAGAFQLPYYQRIAPGAGFFPRWVGLLFVALAVVMVVQSLRGKQVTSESWPDRTGWRNVLVTLVSLGVSIALFDVLGYLLSSALLMLAVLITLRGREKPLLTLALTIGTSLGTYLLFQSWLRVPLPRGLLGL